MIRANPKSSTGRLDLFTRLLADNCGRFETVPPGYTGPLYLEIVPRSFPVKVRTGLSLCQIRFSDGHASLSDDELRAEHERSPLLFNDRGEPLPADKLRLDNGLMMGIATMRDRDVTGPIGFVAKPAVAAAAASPPLGTRRTARLACPPPARGVISSVEAVLPCRRQK